MKTYKEMQESFLREIMAKESIDEYEYITVRNNTTGQYTENSDKFGETTLRVLIKALDKVNFRLKQIKPPDSFTYKFPKSVLLDKDLVEFVKKYEEKILEPSSELKGEEKKAEHQGLIFYVLCGFNSTMIYTSIIYDVFDVDSIRRTKDDVLEFLMEINKGSFQERISCLNAVDKLLDAYPETRTVLCKAVGTEKDLSFHDIALKIIAEESNKLSYMLDFETLIKNFNLHKKLSSDLKSKEEVKNNKPKI